MTLKMKALDKISVRQNPQVHFYVYLRILKEWVMYFQ